MVISPYSKSTKCYGDTVIRRQDKYRSKYQEFIFERVYALSDAIRWWHEYGKECLLLNNV